VLDKTLMDYIQTNYYDQQAVPKIKSVTLCDNDKGVKTFVAQEFIEEYHRFKEEATAEREATASVPASSKLDSFLKRLRGK
jgi:hypothetical protein